MKIPFTSLSPPHVSFSPITYRKMASADQNRNHGLLSAKPALSHFFSFPHKDPTCAISPCNLPTPLSSGVAHPLLPPLFHSVSHSYNQHLHHFNPFDPHPVCFPVSTSPGDYILPASSPLRASLTVAGVGCCILGS